jgi:hexosaminidase
VAPVLSRGGRVVLSGPWYLDVQSPGGYTTYNLKDLWKGMYAVEPLQGLNSSQAANVIGGQACMWSEGVNRFDLDSYAVSKASAVAERLWSDPDATPYDGFEALPRMEELVCRLNMRGVGAEAVNSGFCLSDL